MKKTILIIVAVLVIGFIAIAAFNSKKSSSPTPTPKRDSILGSYYAPRNFPDSFIKLSRSEMDEYFTQNAALGGHVSVIQRWDEPDLEERYKAVLKQAHDRGFKTIIHLDPLTNMTRKAPAPPKTVAGTSFADAAVKKAFIDKALEVASLKPDVLGIGVEVNLLLHENNRTEFENYVALSQEAYAAIKQKYPNQTVTISCNWEVMQMDSQYAELKKLKDSLDIYSFTTYPTVFFKPWPLPANYYANIRTYLPTERIAISELGFASSGGAGNTEARQAEFYKNLPALMSKVKPEYITQFFLFDLPILPEQFNSMGLRKSDASAKKSWDAIVADKF